MEKYSRPLSGLRLYSDDCLPGLVGSLRLRKLAVFFHLFQTSRLATENKSGLGQPSLFKQAKFSWSSTNHWSHCFCWLKQIRAFHLKENLTAFKCLLITKLSSDFLDLDRRFRFRNFLNPQTIAWPADWFLETNHLTFRFSNRRKAV